MATSDDESAGFMTAEGNALAKLLASGLTYAEAGRQLGMSETSVYRRMRDPGFRALVDSWRRQNIDGVLAQLIPEGIRSISYLASVRDDPDTPPYLRVKAAQELLASLARLGRQVTLTEVTPAQAQELMRSMLERFVAEHAAESAES